MATINVIEHVLLDENSYLAYRILQLRQNIVERKGLKMVKESMMESTETYSIGSAEKQSIPKQ
jgi:hypothetical protein